MAPESEFEERIQALLDGRPLPMDESSRSSNPDNEALGAIDLIARAHRTALYGTDVSPEYPASTRWGHLEIRGEIGRGASGTVYRAWDTNLEREVALKVLAPHAAATVDALEEGRLLARLNHPHIVRVFGADTHDEVAGVWMELLDGDTLDEMLARDGVFGVEEALLIALDVAGAVSAVHAAGLLHRDIKARNVLREREGRIVLMDLGSGRTADGTRDGAGETGTPLYMAPEVLTGGPATVRSDVYSLGVLLYRLLARTYPVLASDLNELRSAHATGRRVAVDAARPNLSPFLTTVIERACHPSDGTRYSSAAELESALAGALKRTLSEQMAVDSPMSRRWARWKRATLTAAAILAMTLLSTWSGWDTTQGRAVRRRIGLEVPPRRPLYLVAESGLAIVRGRRFELFPYNPMTATVIAVSRDFGIRTMSGRPPWTTGGAFHLNGTPVTAPQNTVDGICCFYDGTTDGQFNYSVRADSTLLDPIGSRALAPSALYRFARDWSNPQLYFPLAPEATYFGVAYAARSDSFWLTKNLSEFALIEQWGRDGKLASTPVRVAPTLSAIAVDPTDETLWLTRPELSGAMRLDNFDVSGRKLGSVDVTWPHPIWFIGGAEFEWIASK